jgi:hypothetical protein
MNCSKIIKSSLLLGTLVLLAACSSSKFKTDFDYRSGIDFYGYKTFSWLGDKPLKISSDQPSINPLIGGKVEDAVRLELEGKGYKFVKNADDADFVLSFTLGARDKLKVTSYPVAYQGTYGWGGGYYGRGFYGPSYVGVTNQTQVDEYVEGTLAIDIFDVKMKQPVWHGNAKGSLRGGSNKQSVLTKVVDGILANFPPGSKKS